MKAYVPVFLVIVLVALFSAVANSDNIVLPLPDDQPWIALGATPGTLVVHLPVRQCETDSNKGLVYAGTNCEVVPVKENQIILAFRNKKSGHFNFDPRHGKNLAENNYFSVPVGCTELEVLISNGKNSWTKYGAMIPAMKIIGHDILAMPKPQYFGGFRVCRD